MRFTAIATIAAAFATTAAIAQTPLTTIRVASGLIRPVVVTHAAGDFDRIFIVEQRSGSTGRVRIMNLADNSLNASPFLSISGLNTGSEQGLLGLAFHPDYANNGYFFVNYTRSNTTFVERYTVSAGDPDLADPNSGHVIIRISQPFSNHNGGWIGFGPDGFLYISMGDGGSGGDPGDRAQDITNQLLGKMLRIDVDGDDFPGDPNANYAIPPSNPFVDIIGDDEIWAYGLRNPWRSSFDRTTGDLWIADVGQNAWEEVDFQSAASTGGENYGWRCYEGNQPFNTGGCPDPNTMVFPIHVYGHGSGCSISGGYVYRGCDIPDLRGTYFFSDFCTSRLWTFRYDGANVFDFLDRTAELAPGGGLTINSVSSFGEDARGELYICDLGGEIYKVIPETPPCPADFNGDGVANTLDFLDFLNAYNADEPCADFNRDGIINTLDFLAFLNAFNIGC